MSIAVLRHEEAVRLDSARLRALCEELGERAAGDVIERAVQEMALRMGAMERDWQRREVEGFARNARSLARLARQVGMTTFARVAGDVAGCVAAGDMTAAAATWARLCRIGDRSLAAIWDLQDISL